MKILDTRIFRFMSRCLQILLSIALVGAAAHARAGNESENFILAIVPDTQNYLDYRNQKDEGFSFDAGEIFLDQMAFLARNSRTGGGEIEFVISVGDVWQHQSSNVPDQAHRMLGLKAVPNPVLDGAVSPTSKVLEVEMPLARRGYEIISDKIPFAVVPGNHDYDSMWTDSRFPPAENARIVDGHAIDIGKIHIGGFDNWLSVFGSGADFFQGKPWYISSVNGGASSASRFKAGGYSFLVIALEMQPDDSVLKWAQTVLDENKGIPTIIAIHQFLRLDGTRSDDPTLDLRAVHPEHNNPEMIWGKLIKNNDQIFMVVNGHEPGSAKLVSRNDFGHSVYQLLSDYQARQQIMRIFEDVSEKEKKGLGVGDGWLRLMKFDLSDNTPKIHVRTYSTYFHAYSSDIPQYASWYKASEHPKLSDEEFNALDDFVIQLSDFRKRFGQPKAE